MSAEHWRVLGRTTCRGALLGVLLGTGVPGIAGLLYGLTTYDRVAVLFFFLVGVLGGICGLLIGAVAGLLNAPAAIVLSQRRASRCTTSLVHGALSAALVSAVAWKMPAAWCAGLILLFACCGLLAATPAVDRLQSCRWMRRA